MKKLFFFLSLSSLVLMSSSVFSQNKGMTSYLEYHAGTSFASKTSHKLASELNMGAGYNFNKRFSVVAQVGLAIHLYENENVKDYNRGGILGVGVGYNAIANGYDILEIRATVGNTLDCEDWGYMYYDCGIRYAFGKHGTRMSYGLGVKYYQSQKAGYDNILNGYVTLGFKIN